MKKTILLLILVFCGFSLVNAQIAPASVCTSPENYSYDQEVTWYFDLTGNTSVTSGQDLYFWSWEPQELPSGPALMTYESEMLWSLTFIPTTLYGVTVQEIESAGNSAFWCNILDGSDLGTASTVTGTIPYSLKEQLRLGSSCNSFTSCSGTPSTTDNTFIVNFGDVITNPDTNGNNWTNIETTNTDYQLTDKDGVARYDITTSGDFIKYTNPSGFSNPDTSLLGDMAIPLATTSYLYLTTGTGVVSISCLDPTRLYKLSIFGSRNSSSVRETKYTVIGETTTSGILQTSGAGIATNTSLNCNDDEFYMAEVYPTSQGTISIEAVAHSGGFGYLNMLKIEEVVNPNVVEVTGISINTNNLSTTGPSQLSIDYTPANTTQLGVNWSVSDESVAIIDSEGNLKPKIEGTVTVIATSSFNSSLSDQVQVTFANLVNEFYLTGTATEVGSDLPADGLKMRSIKDKDGILTNQFEIYTSMGDSGSFSFFTATDGSGIEYGGNGSGGLVESTNNDIASPGAGWKYVLVDLNEMTYSVNTIYGWNIISHMIPKESGQETWWGGVENLSTYQGNGVWSGTIDFSVATTADDSPRFYIELAGTGRAVKQIDETKNELIFVDRSNGISITDIYQFNGEYTITIDTNSFTYDVSSTCSSVDDTKISIMGSSVAKGFGATIATDDTSQYMGYAHQYNLLLQDRFSNGDGGDWKFSNISIGGDKTTDLLNRFDYHLLTDCSKYVVYGLSLANEGLFTMGQTAYYQFVANMEVLIQKARDNGKVPVVIGNYANGGYNDTQYQFIKDMNLLIHSWDVPSVNVMGTIDDGTGKWVAGHYSDAGHPNDLGYQEMMHAIVPSLFDALNSGKPQPQLVSNTWISLGNQVGRKFILTPEEQVHSFTISINFKTNGNGIILDLENSSQTGNVAIDSSSGKVIYNSPLTGQIEGTAVVNDDNWHTLTLTHFYARGETLIYIDGNEEGKISEQLLLSKTSLNGTNAPTAIDYSNWFFYRSGMNVNEITAMKNGNLLKSSLEVYAPLDGQSVFGNGELFNSAQSTNTIEEESFTLSLDDILKDDSEFRVIPNPAGSETIFYYSLKSASEANISIFNMLGQELGNFVNTDDSAGDYQVSLKSIVKTPMSKGVYLCKLKTASSQATVKLIIE